jgi:hypothetical protein
MSTPRQESPTLPQQAKTENKSPGVHQRGLSLVVAILFPVVPIRVAVVAILPVVAIPPSSPSSPSSSASSALTDSSSSSPGSGSDSPLSESAGGTSDTTGGSGCEGCSYNRQRGDSNGESGVARLGQETSRRLVRPHRRRYHPHDAGAAQIQPVRRMNQPGAERADRAVTAAESAEAPVRPSRSAPQPR